MKILTIIMIGLLLVQAIIFFSNKNSEVDTNEVENDGELDQNDLV